MIHEAVLDDRAEAAAARQRPHRTTPISATRRTRCRGRDSYADLDPANRDPLHTWAIGRTLRIPVDALTISAAPPEYVILRKLEYYREGGSEKHVRDIHAMLSLPLVPLDRDALADWLGRLGLEAQWRLVTGT